MFDLGENGSGIEWTDKDGSFFLFLSSPHISLR